ncbi:MAG: hypothetical protein KBC93_17825 [Candidatus Microthrix sp.]|jgi:hypothetical protein|nr:hypothetical protein [Candidatus Microthrix sp.]
MSKTPGLTVTIPKEKLTALLRERVADLQKQHAADLAAYDKKTEAIRAGQAKALRRKADLIEAGKVDPLNHYDLRDAVGVDAAKGLEAPSKPAKKFACSAQTLLAQVTASTQKDWRIGTETWTEMFGEACEL